MDCEWNDKVQALHDGELAPAVQADAQAHVAGCPACAAELARLQRIARFLTAVPMPEMDRGAVARLREKLNAERVRLAASRRTARLAEWLTAAAAVVLLSCGAALYHTHAKSHAAPVNQVAWSQWVVAPDSESPVALETEDPLTLAVSMANQDEGRE
jgi:anti-sigma factor RsiW